MQYDFFISHAWKPDEIGRDTHERAHHLTKALQQMGYKTWFDDENLRAGHVDSALAAGIEHSRFVVVCITEKYLRKISDALADSSKRDSCAKEWSYAMVRNKHIIPLIFESTMLRSENWPHGPVAMHLGGHMYVNATGENWTKIANDLSELVAPRFEAFDWKHIPYLPPIEQTLEYLKNSNHHNLIPLS